MSEKNTLRSFSTETAIILYLAIFKILIHLLNPEYGYHRDELFYLAIARNFSFSNLDMLPLTPLYLKFMTLLLGTSLKALHFAAALAGAGSVVLSCLIAREMGGKKYAVFLTGLFVIFSAQLSFGSIFTYDSLDFLLWTAALYLLVLLFKEQTARRWLSLAVILGLGLLNKLTILFLGFAIFVCLWLVPQRIYFRQKWIWITAGVALVFSLPFVVWQSSQGWYFLQVAAGYAGGLAYSATFAEFVWNQLLPNNLWNAPVWITGLCLILFSKSWIRYRFFGFLYLFLFVTFFFAGAKFYFLAPVYSILLAAGAVKIEQIFMQISNRKSLKYRMKYILPVVYFTLTLPLLPMSIPLLPLDQFIKFAGAMDVDAGVRTENHQLRQLPQHFADRFGWEEMTALVAHVYIGLEPQEQERTGIVTANWGQASAIDFYRGKYGLPRAVTMHGWYYFEAMRSYEVKDIYIAVGISPGQLRGVFNKIGDPEYFTHPYCMPYESNKPVVVCREPKYDLKRYWQLQQRMDPVLERMLEEEGVAAVVSYYRREKKIDPRFLLFSENQMNALGYAFLSRGETEHAIILFQLNTEAYPASFNVYDSLAEGYMEDGRYELAVKFYKRSIEINPGNTNGRQKLKELYKLISEK